MVRTVKDVRPGFYLTGDLKLVRCSIPDNSKDIEKPILVTDCNPLHDYYVHRDGLVRFDGQADGGDLIERVTAPVALELLNASIQANRDMEGLIRREIAREEAARKERSPGTE